MFSPATLESTPDGFSYDLKQSPPSNPESLAGKRIAILASHGVQEEELVYPYYFLKNRNAMVDIVVPSWTPERVLLVRYMRPTQWVKASKTFAQAVNTDYDLIIVAGGAWATTVIRRDADALKLLRDHFNKGKFLAAVCSGPQVLINANLAKGSSLTSSDSIAIDMRNAGANYIDSPVFVSARLITAKGPNELQEFMRVIERELTK